MPSEDPSILEPGQLVRPLVHRLGAVTNRQLFGFSVLWVLVGGLLLQFVVLPYMLPFAHAGHGLIADLDSVGFHVEATNQAEQIRQLGWGAWEPNPRNYPVALASALYAVTYSEPWVVLPINGILFGIAVVAVRGLLTVLFDSAVVALLALAPFFMFPSFVPIWGQLHKDINTGAGFSVVLCALVLAAKPGPRSLGWLGCAVMAALGMGLMGSSRFYAMAIVAVGTVAFVTLAFLGRNCARGRLLVVAAVVLLAALASIGASTLIRGTVEELTPPPGTRQAAVSTDPASAPSPPAPSPPVPSPPAAPPVETPSVDVSGPSWSWSSLRLPQTRHSDASLSRWDNCLPDPTRDILDRLLFNLCYTREGYVLDALKVEAGSGYDYDVRLRSAEDFLAYGPRAIERGILEPGPKSWGLQKQSTVGEIGMFIVPIEMSAVYVTLFLALVFGGRWRTRPEIWAVSAFCITYTLIYVVATPQMGTLYRMRAFAFTIIISIALAAVLANKTGVGKDARA